MALGVFLAPECVKAVQKAACGSLHCGLHLHHLLFGPLLLILGPEKAPKPHIFIPEPIPRGTQAVSGCLEGLGGTYNHVLKRVPGPGTHQRYQVLAKKNFFFEFVHFWAQKVLFRVETESGGVFWGVWVGEYGQNDIESFFFQKSEKTTFASLFTWGLLPPNPPLPFP